MTGLLFNPLAVYRAFVRGRRTKNLYSDSLTDEQIMNMPLSSIKEQLLLNKFPGKKLGNPIDLFLFALLILFGLVYSVLSLALLPFVFIYTLFVIIRQKKQSSLAD